MNARKLLLITIIATMALTACQINAAPVTADINANDTPPDAFPTAVPVGATPSEIEDAQVLPTNTPEATVPLPPAAKEAAVTLNPLTGLPVEDPENLLLPPALVSVTNFPVSARPQAGLSFSPMVFELFIGEGMTRYLALFYGDYPRTSVPDQGATVQDDLTEGMPVPVVGPVRSGRLPYEHIRKLYNGFIVMASAYSKVAAKLKDY